MIQTFLSLLLLTSATLSVANLVTWVKHERSYNDVDFYEYDSLDDFKSAFFHTEERTANTNVLLGIFLA